MDLDKEMSLNRIPLTTRLKKFKRPIISLLNEYETDESKDYDVFERYRNGICAMVDIPEHLSELHSRLEDMVTVTQIAPLKYEIARDALRLAVHLLYRIILKEKRYDYYDFVLYYEQYNKSWADFSEEYHISYNEWKHSMYFKDECETGPQKKPSSSQSNELGDNSTPFIDLSTSGMAAEKEEKVFNGKAHTVQGCEETKKHDIVSNLSMSRLQLDGKLKTEVDLTIKNLKTAEEAFFKTSNGGENRRCNYIDKLGDIKECPHSKFVIYQLHRTGDFVMATGDDCDNHRECPCYEMKCSVVREIHPCFRDVAWGNKYHCMFKYWCYINCFITSESFEMLKSTNPFIQHLSEGILATFTLNDFKRLSLRTAALKSLVYNYLSNSKYSKKTLP